MKLENDNNLVENISCNIISMIILMNAFQIVISWDFGISFNMWIEYGLIALLFIINRFKIVNLKNIVVIGVTGFIFLINMILNNSETLKIYIKEFILYAFPLLLIFLINIDLKKFMKIFFVYNIINIILYLLVISINPSILIGDYMTFGFYSMFSLSYIIIYSYYNRYMKTMICAIIALPLIFIYGNRGSILIATVTIIMIVILNAKSIKSRLVFTIVAIFLVLNANTIIKNALNFSVEHLGVSNNYSIRNIYNMLDTNDIESKIGGRYDIYKEAIEEFNNHTILGMGVAGFTEKYGYFPHNIFLDVYSTFGIVMGTIYFMYIIIIGVNLYKISNKQRKVQILFIFMFANIMKLMLSKTFIYDPAIWLYISLGNFIIAKYGGKSNENNSIHTDLQ